MWLKHAVVGIVTIYVVLTAHLLVVFECHCNGNVLP